MSLEEGLKVLHASTPMPDMKELILVSTSTSQSKFLNQPMATEI
jgi:hypothetical protein